MLKLPLLSMVVAIAIPVVAHAQPVAEAVAADDREIDCEQTPTCFAEEFADALSAPPAAPQDLPGLRPLRMESLITFEPGRARVYSSGREKLAALAATWRTRGRWPMITVEGYAGAGGKLALAEQRAGRVRDYLVRYGVPPEYVVAIGHDSARGSSSVKRPIGGRVDLAIAACDSEDCRTNRAPTAAVSIVK